MGRIILSALIAFSCVAGTAIGDDGDLERIRDLLRRQMYRTVKPELEALAGDHPKDPAVLETLAEYRLATGDPAGATEAARSAVEAGGGTFDSWMLWGRTCTETGLALAAEGKPASVSGSWFVAAEQTFRKLMQQDLGASEVRWRLGWAMEWQGRRSVAEQFYEMEIDEFPRLAGGHRRLVRLLVTQDRRGEADTAFERGLEKVGEDAGLLFEMGDVLQGAGDKKGALRLFLRAARADPDFKRAWDRAAELCDTAEVLYPLSVEVLKEHPASLSPAWWAGFHANRREPGRREKPWERHVEALEHLLPALEIYGEHEGLYTEAFAAAQVLCGDDPRKAPAPKPGTAAFKRIHAAWTWSGDAANNLGYYYREAKKYDLSIEWYLKAVERAPENQDILNDTGLIYLFHFRRKKKKGLPYFLKTVALVQEGDQAPERGYWDALENLCKHYWEVDRQPKKVIRYARMRYEKTKGVPPYNMSKKAARHAELAKKAVGR